MIKLLYFLVPILIIKFFFFAKKYNYSITVFSGPTGSGKTMLATSMALKLIKQGLPVYSTYYIEGANKLPYNFYDYNFPEESTLIIDESQIGLDSRNFKELVKNGVSTKLKNKLSMHRHQHLDIWFITQQPEEIDSQIRRYCGKLLYCKTTLFKRVFDVSIKEKRFNMNILPYFQFYEVWPDINTYELYKKRIDPHLKPKDYGVRPSFKFITKKTYTKYNTFQQDTKSARLPMIITQKHDNKNELIQTG